MVTVDTYGKWYAKNRLEMLGLELINIKWSQVMVFAMMVTNLSKVDFKQIGTRT